MKTVTQREGDSSHPESTDYFEVMMEDPFGPVRLVIGACGDIGGEGAMENEAQVTPFEIELVARHWAKEFVKVRRDLEVSSQTGNREIRVMPYAWDRLNYFKTILGEERVQAIVEEVFEGKEAELQLEAQAYEAWLKGY